MKRKSLIVILAVATVVLSLCGCQKKEKSIDKETGTEIASTLDPEYTLPAPNTKHEEETENIVEEVEHIPDNFLLGCDVSTLLVQEKSGVVYYDKSGNKDDLMHILAENSVNLARIRVWNDPYDGYGNGYGGGNCDIKTAIEIGKRATENNMGVLIDFHYSDFWADPSKQMCPKAWILMDVDDKAEALYQYTLSGLGEILDEGVNVTMVQLGNETTTGMSGETDWKNITTLMKAGSKAVRELSQKYGKEIKIAIQFTNPEKKKYDWFAKTLEDNQVDYDVFASSYYPFWHGTLDNLQSELANIIHKYHKEVFVAEISYAYTYEDGDDAKNSIYEGAWGEFNYEVSEDGQIEAIRDCALTVASLGEAGLGICYWEPAWIPVPVKDGERRIDIWEKYGSGWASSYAGEYDPNDAGKNYGGSGWDNQALFDYSGHPLKSLDMFNLLRK